MWKFKRITAHEEPLNVSHNSYKGTWCNIMVKWEKGETTTERLYIITVDEPFICDIYIYGNNLLLKVSSTLMLRCIGVKMNYHLLKYGKALIYLYLH